MCSSSMPRRTPKTCCAGSRDQSRPGTRAHPCPAASLVSQHLVVGAGVRRPRSTPSVPARHTRSTTPRRTLVVCARGRPATRPALYRKRNQPRAAVGAPNPSPYVKDGIHEAVVNGIRNGSTRSKAANCRPRQSHRSPPGGASRWRCASLPNHKGSFCRFRRRFHHAHRGSR